MITVAVCQIRTELDQEQTMVKAERMVREAAARGAQIIALPEMWNCPYSKEYFKKYAALGHHDAVKAMSSWAEELGVILVGGSVPETEDGRIYNTCFVFDENGRQIARHRKAHLFDVDLPGMSFKESATFSPGNEITVFETKYGRMGCAVCFDVRFPELFRAMAVRGARIVFLPAQFNMTTGPAHWELTMRNRALDNELFLVAAAAARREGFNYECYGHSMICDPFGCVLAEGDQSECTILTDIDLERIDQVRSQLPTFLHLRRDLYSVAE